MGYVLSLSRSSCLLIFKVLILQIRKTSIQLATLAMTDSKAKGMEIQISKMIMTIVGVFVFCNSFQVLGYFMVGTSGYTFPGYVMFLFANLLVALNSSINVALYGIFNKKYRKLFFKYFCCKSPKHSNDSCTLPMTERKILSMWATT